MGESKPGGTSLVQRDRIGFDNCGNPKQGGKEVAPTIERFNSILSHSHHWWTASRINEAVDNATHQHLVTKSIKRDKARLQSNQGDAGMWLQVPDPQNAAWNNLKAKRIFRIRLGLEILADGVTTCQRKKLDGNLCDAPLDRHGDHAMGCRCGYIRNGRHNGAADIWCKFCKEAGCETNNEVMVPRCGGNAHRQR